MEIFFFSFKIHCLQVFQLFQTKDWPVFYHRHTCLHLSRFFCCIIRKYLSHILFWSQLVSSCFALKLFFSFTTYCLQMFQLFLTKDGPIFFIVTLVYICHTFFNCIIRKYLSHILFWSQLVTVCFAMKFFFSFKMHCLQMFQLFQTRDGPFFFIVTLVYTCHAFFAVSSLSTSVSVVSDQGLAIFFSSSYLPTLGALFLLYHQKIFVPFIVLVTARLSLFRNEIVVLL